MFKTWALGTAALLPAAALAAPAPVQTTEAVVVTAARSEQELSEVTSSVSVLGAEELRQKNEDNLPSLLQDVNSVKLISDGTPGVKRISLRGESSSRTLLLFDGQRFDDAKTKSGAPFLVNPFFIDRLEIVRGPSSVLYGSDALGGIVNVISYDYHDRPVGGDVGIFYNGQGEGFSEYLNLSGTVGDFKYKLGGFGTEMGDMYLSGHDRLDSTSYRQKGFNGAISYDFTEHFNAELSHEYFDLAAHTASTSKDSQYSEFTGYLPAWSRQKTVLGLNFTDLNDTVQKVSFKIYQQKNKKDFNSQVSAAGPFVFAYNDQQTYGFNLQTELALNDYLFLITGVESRFDELDSDSGAIINMGPVVGQGLATIKDRDYKQQHHAWYGLLEAYLTDDLTAQFGLRYNYVKTDSGTSSMGMTMGDYGTFSYDTSSDGSVHHSQWVGSFGLNYRLTDHAALRANYSQGYRVPNLQELYITTFTGQMQQGNSSLDVETSDNYEIGMNYRNGGLTADLSLFYSVADDYIDTVNIGNWSSMEVYSYRNISKAKTFGAELELSYTRGSFTPYLNVTAMRRKYDTGSDSSCDTGVPKLKGRLGLKYEDDYEINHYYLDLFTRFATATDNDNLDGSSYFDDYHLAGYATLNLSFGLYVGADQALKIYASAENILDQRYQVSELIEEPGRFFTLGASYSF